MDKKTLIDKVKECEAFETENRMGKIYEARAKAKAIQEAERKSFEEYNRGFIDGFQDGYGSAVDALEDTLRNCVGEVTAEKSEAPSNDLPLPVVRVGNREMKRCSTVDWLAKVIEEVSEVGTAKNEPCMVEEIADFITVGISWLNALGYNEQARAKIFRAVNAKNRARGYLGDKS